ncbi:MAG: hypothetical protein JWR09_3907 [Mucilaginibacter sp.]|nr:hypothetical protein [Mucilaginibacter sp.]
MKQFSKLFAAFTFAVTVFLADNAKGQTTQVNTLGFGIGAESGITTGAISGAPNAYVGATTRLQYGLSEKFALTLTTGYYNFFGNHYHNSMGMIPVKAGFKYFVGSGFYISGEAGAGFELQNFNVVNDPNNGSPGTRLLWSAGFGYATNSWDFGLRYENFSGSATYASQTYAGQNNSYGLVGLRVGHGFGLN